MPRSYKNSHSQTNKDNKYSNTFQIHKKRGVFQDINTCDVTNVETVVYCSVLLDKSESHTIVCRPNINTLLEKSIEIFLTANSVSTRRERANEVYPDPKFLEKYFDESTYVSLDDEMLTQIDAGIEKLIVMTWNLEQNNRSTNVVFAK